MPLDAALVAERRSWLVKAKKDLRAAQDGLGASPALLDDAAFHSLAVQFNPAAVGSAPQERLIRQEIQQILLLGERK